MKRYWVGTNGSWFDRSNWSETPGGELGATVPSGGDTAVFDRSACVFEVSPNVELWPGVIVGGSWTTLLLICSENDFDESLLPEKVTVGENNLFRFFGLEVSAGRRVYERAGPRGPYEPLVACAVDRVHGSFDTFLLRIGECRAETITVDWGDGAVETIPYSIDRPGRGTTGSLLSHKYESPGRYVVRVTACSGEYDRETGADENGEPLLRLFSTADVFVDEVFCNVPLPVYPPPAARLEIAEWNGVAPFPVTISTAGSVGVEMLLDWGDGMNGGLVEPTDEFSHIYEEPGEFTVTLKIRNEAGIWDEATWPIAVTAPEAEPGPPAIEAFEVRQRGENALQVTAEWETDADVVMLDWGDGNTGQHLAEKMAGHTYRQGGRYLVKLAASNKAGTVAETRLIEMIVTNCGMASMYSRFDRMVVVKTSLGKGEMA